MRIWSLAAGVVLPMVALAAPQTWTIGNSEVQRTLAFGSSGLVTEGLTDLKTHTTFIAPGNVRSEEFSFQCNGHAYSGHSSEFTLLGAEESSLANGKSLTVRLRGAKLALDVSVVYNVITGIQPYVSIWY